jgi:hypothetical protein
MQDHDILPDDLRARIATGRAVAIVGAGIAIAASGNTSVASWTGLLRDGVQRCHAVIPGLPANWVDRRLEDLKSGDMDELLSVAEQVSAKLGAPKGGEFSRWLRETVGTLAVRNPGVIEAIAGLGIPIITTNYDGLIEEVTALHSATWLDGGRVARIIQRDEPGVVHIHGYWERSESVILGIKSYESIGRDALAQAVLHALRTVSTLVFIGCGDGLSDPNFGALLRWSRTAFAGDEYRHFRLARDSEIVTLQQQHPSEERIFVISYGDSHSELEPFLRSLRPVSKAPSLPISTGSPPLQLPGRPRCLGRDATIDDIAMTMISPNPQPIPILGGPGIGKSTVALALLYDARVSARFNNRRYFVRCDSAKSADAVRVELAQMLGIPVGAHMRDQVRSHLTEFPAALVLDNLETPWEADPLNVEELLRELASLPSIALVVALRGRQRPLGPNWRESVTVTPLSIDDARRLFLAIAGALFEADSRLGDLLTALDGIPLAVELMAHLAQAEPDLSTTWDRWQKERTMMLQRAGGASRLESIEVSFETSITGPRMTGGARRLLALLGRLPDGIAHADLPHLVPKISNAVSTLRGVGLAFDEGGRIRLLAPLREYVSRNHTPLGDDWRGAVNHYCDLARQLGPSVSVHAA